MISKVKTIIANIIVANTHLLELTYTIVCSPQLEGQSSFLFPLKDLANLYGDKPVGQEVHINVSVYDWFLQQNRTGSAVTVISSNDVTMKLLGDYSRSFRPGFPVSLYVSTRNCFIKIRRRI